MQNTIKYIKFFIVDDNDNELNINELGIKEVIKSNVEEFLEELKTIDEGDDERNRLLRAIGNSVIDYDDDDNILLTKIYGEFSKDLCLSEYDGYLSIPVEINTNENSYGGIFTYEFN
jgi:vacuolar-type H+-ATPase subunit E/Vma4